jgi:hypothetical protein
MNRGGLIMSIRSIGLGTACAIALSASLAAQEPITPPATRPSTAPQPPTVSATVAQQEAAAANQGTPVTIEGCIVQEADAPGRKPPEDMQERIKAKNDYVLADAKVINNSPTAEPAAKAVEVVGTSGTAAPALMYFIQDMSKPELKSHENRRVQIDGTLTNLDRATNPVSFGNDLVEIHGTAIREVPGTCSGKDDKEK